jgi:glutamate-5-semialdehyde dehydrogenase
MASLSTEVKNAALRNVARALVEREDEILEANRLDQEGGRAAGLDASFLDRMLLTHDRLAAMADDVCTIAGLPDPVGETFDMRTLPNGLQVGRRRVPLGVIGTIYESRPNVTVDIASLCLKSGNAVILRGGKEAVRSNQALGRVVIDAVTAAGVPQGAVQVVESTDRALVDEMLRMRDVIDLLVPRGGSQLIRYVIENATMPVISGGIGVCHTYVDADAGVEMAVDVVHNAKTRRPSICNALDTVLVHSRVAPAFLPALARRWAEAGVEIRCDRRAETILAAQEVPGLRLVSARPEDFGTEFLALVASVKVVDSLDDALAHIEEYGSGHSEAIITQSYENAMRFLNEADAAAVFVNASTQFTDGGQFGLGAEVGISTGKFHARGPMGLREMTTYKWVILGNGHTRP